MNILVLGDFIQDHYVFGTATRLCPEAPVPVLSSTISKASAGGAGLVAEQLAELIGVAPHAWYGSFSLKERIYAGSHLLCRIDKDSQTLKPWRPDILNAVDIIIVSDYGKGAITQEIARQIIETGKPIFCDAKLHWHWFEGKNVTIFPNHHEATPVTIMKESSTTEFSQNAIVYRQCEYGRIVSKMGADGCRLNDSEHKDLIIPATATEVVDVCGAGDTFMAGFVWSYSLQVPIEDCLKLANILAGESCRHLGTYVVPRAFAIEALDKLQASKESAQPVRESSQSSIPRVPEQILQQYRDYDTFLEQAVGSLPIGYVQDQAARVGVRNNPALSQTLRILPSDPIGLNDTPPLSDQGKSDLPGTK